MQRQRLDRIAAFLAHGAHRFQRANLLEVLWNLPRKRREDASESERAACGRPLSLRILGWLEAELTPAQIESVAGLAVFPLVPLMTITSAMQSNLAQVRADKHARGLPLPQTSMADFKKLIGFDEIEKIQNRFEMR